MISIISPIYNCAPYIEACLDSLLAQTMQDFEVILVDDHGGDNSMALARAWVGLRGEEDRFRFLSTSENSGPGVARNIGIEAARGEYIAFIDSDDLWQPTFLEQLSHAVVLESDAASDTSSGSVQADLAYCQLQYQGGPRDGQVHRNPVVASGLFSPSAKRHFLMHFVTFSVCFLFNRKFLNDNELRFPSEHNSEDTNFLTRCLLAARTIACVDQSLYIYCVRQQSLTTRHDPHRYKQRLSAANKLIAAFRQMKSQPRFQDLDLAQYNVTMWILYLKKGVAQAILELIR